MAGEIQALFDKYQNWHPYYSRDAIVDMMLEDGVITADAAKKIKSGLSLFLIDNSIIDINKDSKENLPYLDSFEPQKNDKKINSTKLYHPKFDNLEVDNNGKVVAEQFSLEAVKKKYSDKKYKIVNSVDGFKVVNKQTDIEVFETYSFDNYEGKRVCNVRFYDDNGNLVNCGELVKNEIVYWEKYNKKGEIIYSEQYNETEKKFLVTDSFGTETTTIYDTKTNKIKERTVNYKGGSSKFAHYENGVISREWYKDKDGKDLKTVVYSGGKPFVETDPDYVTTRYYLVEDLTSKIKSTNKTKQKSLVEDIKTRINKDNVFILYRDYFEQTGNALLDDIDKTLLSDKEKEDLKHYIVKTLANMTQIPNEDTIAKIIHNDIKGIGSGNLKYHVEAFFNVKNENHRNHIAGITGSYKRLTGNDLSEDIMSEYGLGDERNSLALKVDKMFCSKTNWSRSYDAVCKYLADRISYDISGVGSGNLVQHIMMLNKDNVIGVLKHYTRPQILGVDVTNVLQFFEITKDDYEDWAEMEPLICAIYDEWGLDDETKGKLVNHIIKCVDKCHSNQYTDESSKVEVHYSDIAHDLITNKNDSDKVKIDAKRLDNRIEASYDNTMQPAVPSYPNGKIDEDFEQNTTGDCWLLAGLISSIRKPLGKKMLEDLLTVDNERRQVTVNLKGVNKKYVISFDEIIASNHLVYGDGDIRAIEIAVDRYLKGEAYARRDKHVDINGNKCKVIFNALFGNGIDVDLKDVTNEDLNSSDRAYTISFNRTKIDGHIYPNAAYDEKGKPMDITRGHAYGVMKADDKFVWLLNPWNPSSKKPIRIRWEKLKELNITIEYAQFKQ